MFPVIFPRSFAVHIPIIPGWLPAYVLGRAKRLVVWARKAAAESDGEKND